MRDFFIFIRGSRWIDIVDLVAQSAVPNGPFDRDDPAFRVDSANGDPILFIDMFHGDDGTAGALELERVTDRLGGGVDFVVRVQLSGRHPGHVETTHVLRRFLDCVNAIGMNGCGRLYGRSEIESEEIDFYRKPNGERQTFDRFFGRGDRG